MMMMNMAVMPITCLEQNKALNGQYVLERMNENGDYNGLTDNKA